NSAQVLSIGIFFSLMIVGLASSLPHALASGLQAHGVDHQTATQVADVPPVSVLFASFLGYNPAQQLLGPHVLAQLSPDQAATITGRTFFPGLMRGPSHSGLHVAFAFAIVACLVAAAASWSRGGRYVPLDAPAPAASGEPIA